MTQGSEDDWDVLSLDLANDPDNFKRWEKLIEQVSSKLSKVSPLEKLQQFRLSFSQLLLKYPFLEQYWVNFAELEFKLGNTQEAKRIYVNGLSVVPYSILLWVNYLKFVNLTELDYDTVLGHYIDAELKIGFHYHSYEFWKGYLEFEESHRGKSTYWYNLLKKVTEIPLYNFAYFFKILLGEIESLSDKETGYKIVDSLELHKKLKIDTKQEEWSKEVLHDLRSKLKKTYTDAYITTQFLSFEAYQFEKNVKLEYFVPGVYQSYQDLDNWDRYLSHMELSGTELQIKQLYHRALVPTASYPNIWLKFADYYIHRGKLQSAKNLLHLSLVHMSDAMLVPIQLKLIKLELALGNYIKARDMVLASLTKNGENVELWVQLLNVEYLLVTMRETSGTEDFKTFVVSILKGKPSELCCSLLKHISGYKSLGLDFVDLLELVRPQLEKSERYWLLVLAHTEATDSQRVYGEAVALVGGDSPLLSRWYSNHLSYTASGDGLRRHFEQSTDWMLAVDGQ